MKRTFRAIVLVVLCIIPAALSALDFKVRVYSPAAGKNLPDVLVVVLEAGAKAYTDDKGDASFTVAKEGFYSVRVVLPDGRIVQQRLQVNTPNQVLVILSEERTADNNGPKETEVTRDGVVVTGKRDKSKLSRYNVRLDEIKRVPGTFGEALRGLESLPGITAPAFGSGEIVVRGANENANTYLVDELPIGYAFHLFPINSTLHNDLIKSIDIYTGAYPANFGDATGGVIAIETIDKVEKFGGHATISLFSANALFKAPVFDNSGYWIATGRASYLDKTLAPYIPDGIRPPQYFDSQFKMEVRPAAGHTIYFYVLWAKDSFGAEVKSTPEWDPTAEPDPIFIGARIALDRGFHTEGVRYIWQPSSSFQNRLTSYYHTNIFYIDGSLGVLDAKVQVQDGWVALKDEFSWELMRDHVFFDGGVELRQFQYRQNGTTIRLIDPNDPNPDFYDRVNPHFQNVPVHDSNKAAYDTGFLMWTLKGAGFEFKPGVRADYFGLTKQTVVDPRGTLSYSAPTQTVFTAGAGVYHKTPEANEYSPSSGNPDLKMERAEHYGVGVEQTVRQWTFKVEGYKHFFTDIVVSDPYIVTPVRKNQDPYKQYSEPYLYNDRLGYSNDGTGYSDGYEIFIKKNKKEADFGWYGWLSYTWSRTFRNSHQHKITDDEKKTVMSADERRLVNQYDNTKDRPADFDRRHIINIIFGYKFNREWQLGLKWKYMTSQPYTPITGDDGAKQNNNGRPIFDPKYSDETNSGRLKPYHRLDLRIDRFINYDWGFGNVFIEVLNVYLRDNPTSLEWNRSEPYSRNNPAVAYDFGTLEVPAGKGKKAKIPLVNFGVEVQF